MPEAGEPAVLQDIKAALQASDLSRATTLAREALTGAMPKLLPTCSMRRPSRQTTWAYATRSAWRTQGTGATAKPSRVSMR